MKAIIKDTKGWKNHWFEGKEGKEIEVREYPYKSCLGGYIDYCSCIECVIERAGKKMYDTYEVLGGTDEIKVGSIIPICCIDIC